MPKNQPELEDEPTGTEVEDQPEGDQPEAEPVTTDAEEAALAEAVTALATAQAEMVAAATSNDLPAMLKVGAALQVAERNREKAQNALDAALFEVRAAERMEFVVSAKEELEAFLDTIDLERMVGLGLISIQVTLDPENPTSPLVNILSKDKPVAGRKVSATRQPGGVTKGRANILYQGQEYNAAEFILKFGGDDGAKAVDKARNYKDYGLKFSPGFDAFKKKLMRELGATFTE